MTIPNWTMFGAQGVAIQLHYVDTIGQYNAAISILLDDGTDDEDDKVVTIFTEVYDDSPEKAAVLVANRLVHLFDNVADSVMVFDDGEIEREFSLNESIKSVYVAEAISDIEPASRTLH